MATKAYGIDFAQAQLKYIKGSRIVLDEHNVIAPLIARRHCSGKKLMRCMKSSL